MLHEGSTLPSPDPLPVDLPPTVDAATLEALAVVTGSLYVSERLPDVLARVAAAAVAVVAPCDVASLTMRDAGRLVTQASTGELATRADELQYELGEGPCLDAVERTSPVHAPDLAADERWPAFTSRAVDGGVGGTLSCRLSVPTADGEQALGSVNLYATRRAAFTADDVLMATLFARHAAVVIQAAGREAQLREALASRDVIGQAKGILMAQRQISADEAFDQLRVASQRLNVKLRDVALDVVARRNLGSATAPEA